MRCHCIKCGYPCDCGEEYCESCFIERLKTDAEKNLYLGGRFYPSVRLEANMIDWNKVIPIVVIAVVTVLSFLLLPLDSGIQDKLVLALASLAGLYPIGAAVKFTFNRLAGKND